MGILKELWPLFFNAIKVRLAPFGYKARKTDRRFYNSIAAGGSKGLHLSLPSEKDHFGVFPDVWIRFDAAEDLINDFIGTLPKRERRRTATLGFTLGELVGVGWLRWTISKEGEIDHVADKLVSIFVENAVPCLDYHSDPNNAMKWLTGEDGRKWCYRANTNLHSVAISAVALASISGDDARESIATELENQLIAIDSSGLSTFREFVVWLRERPDQS